VFTAYDVNKAEVPSDGQRKIYPFGIGPKRCADELRKFADDVENSKVILQRVTIKSIAQLDEFPMTHLEIEFFEPKEK
jgi:hypothetical protein